MFNSLHLITKVFEPVSNNAAASILYFCTIKYKSFPFNIEVN